MKNYCARWAKPFKLYPFLRTSPKPNGRKLVKKKREANTRIEEQQAKKKKRKGRRQGERKHLLGLLGGATEELTYENGDTVFSEGDRGEAFYIVKSGKAKVSALHASSFCDTFARLVLCWRGVVLYAVFM